MADVATPTLVSANFERTVRFYESLGFIITARRRGWLILNRGGLTLEFASGRGDPHRDAPSCCLRVDDLDALYAAFAESELAKSPWSRPSLDEPQEHEGQRSFKLVDPDGNALRCLEN